MVVSKNFSTTLWVTLQVYCVYARFDLMTYIFLQASVRELRGLGISPDLIVCRSEKRVDESVKEKISNFCHVRPDQVEIYSLFKSCLIQGKILITSAKSSYGAV